MMATSLPAQAAGVLLAAQGVSKYYGSAHDQLLVLDSVSLALREREFVALLGPSGSGKSTLLRILAGLVSPSSGQVLSQGQPLVGTNPQVAIVFQNFALFPWLTILENVQLGLLAKELGAEERRDRALAAIDLIGLDGFESAYPREISGGMKQRVGLARALVVEPEALFLDEPFSALDVLVAENLRHELLDLWRERRIPTKAILMVTHNIDEAVTMADRLIVFGANPGRIRAELPGLSVSDRASKDTAHSQLVDTVYRIMTNPDIAAADLIPSAPPTRAAYQALPHISIGELTGFIERLNASGGAADLFTLARDLHKEADDILPLAQAVELLDFGDLREGDVLLTDAGREFARAGVLEEKELFRRQSLGAIELLRQIERELRAAPGGRLREEKILHALEESFSEDEARRQLDTAIDWGRYAELFTYDDGAGEFMRDDMSSSAASH